MHVTVFNVSVSKLGCSSVADPEILEGGFQVEVIVREAREIFGPHPLLHCHAHILCKES